MWQQELVRVTPHWKESKRQHLSVGLAGYAWHLGLSREQVIQDITALATSAADPELSKRLHAGQQTFDKAKVGKPVAFKKFYARAGLQSPSITRPPEIVLTRVNEFQVLSNTRAWVGRGATNDQTVYRVLLEKARHVGKEHPQGVSVNLSVRDLALEANICHKTASNVIQRLLKLKLIARPPARQAKGDRAGAFILLFQEADTNLLHTYRNTGDAECSKIVSQARNGKGRLGKNAVIAHMKLVELGGRAPLQRWASSLGKGAKALQRSREKLQAAGLVTYHGREYHVAHDWQAKRLSEN